MAIHVMSQRKALPATKIVATAVLVAAGVVAVALAVEDAPGYYRKVILAAGLAALCWIAVHDSHTLRAPNRIVYPVAIIATVAPFALDIETGLSALAGATLAFVLLLVAVIAGRGAMGYGDAKVAYVCGALVGVAGVIPMLLLTFVLGFAVATCALLLRLRGRKDVIAFTPFLFLGVAVLLLVANHSVYIPASG